MPLDDLPRIDEHTVTVAATAEATWDAAVTTLGRVFGRPGSRRVAGLLGCEPAFTAAWDRAAVGSSIPGFAIVAAERPSLLVVAGRHRFSRYGIVVRIDRRGGIEGGDAVTCRAETRAVFPGTAGKLYRLAVIGSGGHVVAVRSILRGIQRAAEDAGGRRS